MCFHKWLIKESYSRVTFKYIDENLKIGPFVLWNFIVGLLPGSLMLYQVYLAEQGASGLFSYAVLAVMASAFIGLCIAITTGLIFIVADSLVKQTDKVCVKCHKVSLKATKYKPIWDAYVLERDRRKENESLMKEKRKRLATEIFDRIRVGYHEEA